MNDTHPLVSVIIPVYKVEKYLDASVTSVRSQSYSDLEIILVDDCSPDRCGAMCDSYVAEDPRIRVIHKENGGVASARNLGLDLATGAYLIFIDSDDVMPPYAIETMMEHAIAYDADMVCGSHSVIDEQGIPIRAIPSEYETCRRMDTNEALRYYAPEEWGPWNRLMRRHVHASIYFPDYRIHEDEAIKFLLLERCRTVVRLFRTTYLYRSRAGSATSADSGVDRMDMFYSRKENLDYLEQYHPELVDLFLPKVCEDALLNLDRSSRAGHRAENDRIRQILNFANTYHRQIVRCPHTTRSQKLRFLLIRWSDWSKKDCLYLRVYAWLEKLKGR